MVENEIEENKSTEKKEISLKTLIIGDSRVGKTSLLLKYIDHVFPEEHISTIGVEYKDKVIEKDNYNIRLQIWDTAGHERFHSITKNIYRGVNGVLFVYDVTLRKSFNSMKNWIKDTENIDKDIKGIIVGNKIDLSEKIEIQKDELNELGEKKNMPVIECSAKENINVNEAFDLIIEELLKGKTDNEILELYERKTKSDLSISSKKTAGSKKGAGGCC
jgi:small GTP-binding protein